MISQFTLGNLLPSIDWISVFTGGLIVWLLGWVGKHVLDRLFLPRLFDWWARRNAKRALKRAEELIAQHKDRVLMARDDRRIVLYVAGEMISAMAVWTIYTLVVITLSNVIQLGPIVGLSGQIYLMLSSTSTAIVVISGRFGRIVTEINAIKSCINNPAEYHNQLRERLLLLLKSNGMSDDEANNWILRELPSISEILGVKELPKTDRDSASS